MPMLKWITFRVVIYALLYLVMISCSPYFYQPLQNRNAQLGAETQLKKELLNLPSPKEPIVVAVYKFRDQTGQYKASETGSSWSTAVTQGATNILIRTLDESGWFIPIERENISNLLNERKIIRSSRQQYEGNSNVTLPPLLFAGIILEGGIVSYETNVFTGGAGVRYFGTDASAQYREDRITIYLRAVSTSNGKILKTVYTTKSILSQEVTAGVFRYVKYKRLLEAETGYTYNEPTEIAITEAIEKAVHSLIIEGTYDNLWALKNPEEIESKTFQQYKKEKEENLEVDMLGRKYRNNYRSGFYISALGSAQSYLGDYPNYNMQYGITYNMGIRLSHSFFMEINAGYEELGISKLMNTEQYFSDVNLMYMANTRGKFSPTLSLGGGSYYNMGKELGASHKTWIPYLGVNGGMECLLSNKIAISGKAFLNHMFTDYYDNQKQGEFNDYIWGLRLGVRLYIGRNKNK